MFCHRPQFFYFIGIDGSVGKAGIGGKAGKNGDTIKVRYEVADSLFGPFYNLKEKSSSTVIGDNGKNGRNGGNTLRQEQPTLPRTLNNPSHIVNKYKNFVRNNLAKTLRKSKLELLLNELENNKSIKQLYDTLGLFDEFQRLGEQYFSLKNELSFGPFIESLLQRILEYAKSNPAPEQKKILSLLYTAVLSMQCNIDKTSKSTTKLNLYSYLELMENTINKLLTYSSQELIINRRNQFNSTLNDKIKSIDTFIHNEIIPEINFILNQTDAKIFDLIKENIEKQNQTYDNMDAEVKQLETLQNLMMQRQLLYPIKIASSFISMIGPQGAATSAIINTGTSIVDSTLLQDPKSTVKVGTTSLAFKNAMTDLSEQFKNKQTLFQTKLDEIDIILNEISLDDIDVEFQSYGNRIKEIKKEVNQMYEDGSDDPAKFLRLNELRTELDDNTTKEKKRLEVQKTKHKWDNHEAKQKLNEKLKIISNVQKLVNVADLTVDFYNQIKNDQQKIDATLNVLGDLSDKIKLLKTHENRIHKNLIPEFIKIKQTIFEVDHLKVNSHVENHITKWKIQSALRDIRVVFKKMTAEFNVQDDMLRCIEKLDEAMAVLIDIYDQIISNRERSELVTLITDVVSDKSKLIQINDEELADATVHLNNIIQSNLVLDQYEIAMHTFKQHYFPYAYQYLDKFRLPTELNFNDTQSLVAKAVQKIQNLKNDIKNSQLSIEEYKRYKVIDVQFDRKTRHSQPFYVWKYNESVKELYKLLHGKEITLLADISKALNSKNAIKFNEIGLEFRIANETRQNDLDVVLENFRLTLSMIGNNYYRCSKRVYYVTTDGNIVISYNMLKDADGRQTAKSEIYDDIRKNNPFLSPFAMWSIKLQNLTSDAFGKLQTFEDDSIDLELIGHGEYISSEIDLKICNRHLNDYYNFDMTLSSEDNVVGLQ